jgi:capsular polysaccharide biosynthesis protein
MATVLDTSETAELPLAGIHDGSDVPRRFVLMQGGIKSRISPELWQTTPNISAIHNMSRHTPNIDVLFVNKVAIGGKGAAIKREGAYLWDRSVYPTYIRQYYSNNTGQERWAYETNLTPIKVKSALSVMHFNFGYGHWLTEIFPKLFVIRMLSALGVTAPLAWPTTTHAHLRKRTEEFLPGQEFIDYNPATHFIDAEEVILPGAGSHDHFFHPILSEWFQSYPRRFAENTKRGSFLFISRGALKHEYMYRNLVNAAELERMAVSMGAEVYHPELDPPDVQAARYAGASMIAGEYGSGLHNSVFSPPGTAVVALNWVNGVQSRISNLLGQRVGYVLAEDDTPRLFSNNGTIAEYSVDVRHFQMKLAEALDVVQYGSLVVPPLPEEAALVMQPS